MLQIQLFLQDTDVTIWTTHHFHQLDHKAGFVQMLWGNQAPGGFRVGGCGGGVDFRRHDGSEISIYRHYSGLHVPDARNI